MPPETTKVPAKVKTRITKTDLRIVKAATDIGMESAIHADSIAFGCRWLLMATLPYKRTDDIVFTRRNGRVRIRYIASGEWGMPYGPKPRLIGTWIETEIVRTRERTITLGKTWSDFMRKLCMSSASGGRNFRALQDQACRLFGCSVTVTLPEQHRWRHKKLDLVTEADIWLSAKEPDQRSLFPSSITVGEQYYHEVLAHPVPLDWRALAALQHSAMGLDIYRWYASRLCMLDRPLFVSWRDVAHQIGTSFEDTANGRKYLKREYKRQHRAVSTLYTKARVEFPRGGVLLYPSPPPVRPIRGGKPLKFKDAKK